MLRASKTINWRMRAIDGAGACVPVRVVGAFAQSCLINWILWYILVMQMRGWGYLQALHTQWMVLTCMSSHMILWWRQLHGDQNFWKYLNSVASALVCINQINLLSEGLYDHLHMYNDTDLHLYGQAITSWCVQISRLYMLCRSSMQLSETNRNYAVWHSLHAPLPKCMTLKQHW